MKINDLIKELTKISKKYGNLDIIHSCDDEGNSYSTITSDSIGYHKEENEICIYPGRLLDR